jgi:hypothetical protein
MSVIDADAHVIETSRTWEFLDDADPHQKIDAVAVLRSREDVEPRIVEKILDDNARALYGL